MSFCSMVENTPRKSITPEQLDLQLVLYLVEVGSSGLAVSELWRLSSGRLG